MMPLQNTILFKVGIFASGPSAAAYSNDAMFTYIFGDENVLEEDPSVTHENKLIVSDNTTPGDSQVVETTGDVPSSRVGGSLIFVGDILYLFGGNDATGTQLSDLYAYNTSTKIWTLVSSEDGPTGRSYHLMKADSSRVYIYGGTGVNGQLNDLWTFDVNENKWTSFPDPPLESTQDIGSVSSGLAIANSKLWLLHGFPSGEESSILCFDLTDESWTRIEPKIAETPKPQILFSTNAVGPYVFAYGGLKKGDEDEMPPESTERRHPGVVFGLDTVSNVWIRWDDEGYDGDYLPPSGHEYNVPGLDGLAGLQDYVGWDGIELVAPYYIKNEDDE